MPFPASPFSGIEEAIADFRDGKMLVVVDDEDRENEGDLTIAAGKITPEIINFMAVHGRGLICLAMAIVPWGCWRITTTSELAIVYLENSS